MGQIAERTLTVQGRAARVWRGGSGPALLLLHGGLGDAQWHWQTVWEGLAASFTVAAPDLPGFAGTAPMPSATWCAFVDWTAALMETLGFPRAAILGNSFGAGVARLYAAAHPVRVTRLVLVNGGALPRVSRAVKIALAVPRLSNWMIEIVRRRAFSRAGLRPYFADERLLTPEFIARSRSASKGFVRAMRQAASADPPAEQTPRSPTLVLWGEADRASRPERGRALAAEIPGAVFQTIPHAGHMPQLEQPAQFIAAARQFCGQR